MKIGVVGASGYAGGELLRLLAKHPAFETIYIAAGSNAGEKITSIHSHLSAYSGQTFSSTASSEINRCDLVFLALPHGESASIIKEIGDQVKVVDLGADFRLKSATSWKKYYNDSYAGNWLYALPELPGKRSAIAAAARVANPGCYATAIALAAAPAVRGGGINGSDIVVVAASGTTGAGRTAKVNLSGSEIMNSLTSYKFGGVHQHTPEVEQALTKISGVKARISFTPILAPMPRGILSTITAKLTKKISTDEVHAIYTNYFASSHFVTVLPVGVMPKTAALTGSNHVQIQVAVDEHASRLVISVAIDNLGKGAAAQAIHNANLMVGIDPQTGLTGNGLGA